MGEAKGRGGKETVMVGQLTKLADCKRLSFNSSIGIQKLLTKTSLWQSYCKHERTQYQSA